MGPYNRLLLPENLNYAWLKARKLYRMADGYTDNGELAEFELDLDQRLRRIQRQFERGAYRLNPLRPLPRPKKIGNNGKPVDRQYFHVAVDDQVAWIAVVNALGPELDQRMPPWSYGNRIYRPAWYDHGEDRHSKLEIGPYRHASGHLYRKFQHSWPLFRRQVALTARAMVRTPPGDHEEMDTSDTLAAASAEKEGLPYLQRGFWRLGEEKEDSGELFHASIDLKQFYPKLRTTAVLNGLALAGAADDERMQHLLKGMLRFRLNDSGMPLEILEPVEPNFPRRQFSGIPTGLFAAGFLANAAMLPIDIEVDNHIHARRSIAHFRFVDDHTILAYNFEDLCDWIDWYQALLSQFKTGAEVNSEKYDPASLSEWMSARTKASKSMKTPSARSRKQQDAKRDIAIGETKLDGKNPTRLLTKTLGQVSAIAAANVDVLDDDDLQDRLKLLEWLLLANIPEREIRPDTRAAFAAGQIAALAPILIQETDGLVDAERSFASLRSKVPDPDRATEAEMSSYKTALENLGNLITKLRNEYNKVEESHLRRCFGMLIQAFREYPGKSRLFFRMHQYCRVTGFKGLDQIAGWITETRDRGNRVWADYYAGLSLQLLAKSVLLAARLAGSQNTLRSDREAAVRHIEDIAKLDTVSFFVLRDCEAWFHALVRKEFGVALLSAAEVIRRIPNCNSLGSDLEALAGKCVNVSFEQPPEDWKLETGNNPGVWAHFSESILCFDGKPSPTWERFQPLFSLAQTADARAARRYPGHLSVDLWRQLLHSPEPPPETDSGWLREVMDGNSKRIGEAHSSKRLALLRAARSLEKPPKGWLTLMEWTRITSSQASPFDPRRSEWTALEIIRQLVSPILDISIDQSILDHLQPINILVPESWLSSFQLSNDRAGVSWEAWRKFAQNEDNGRIRLRGSANSISDYRYSADIRDARQLGEWDRRLMGLGRVLLGALREDHAAPRVWNIRGNERIYMLPLARWFQNLTISSSTLILVEGCISGRSAETRAIATKPSLFGWSDGIEANDAEFDPPLLLGPNDLMRAIAHAQGVLQHNQLAVAFNQPRQLIPFRLGDFATGPDDDGAEGNVDE